MTIHEFKKGMVCRHHSGKVYTIIELTNTKRLSDAFPVTVVYMGTNGNMWSRPLSEFEEKFEVIYDGTQLVPPGEE